MDARALTEPVDRRTARAYVKQLKASGRMPSASPVGLIIGIAVFAVFLLMFGTVFIGIIGSILSMRAGGFAAVVPVLVFAALVVGAGFVIWDGSSQGSRANIRHLCERGRYIVVFLRAENRFAVLSSNAKRMAFLTSGRLD